MKARKYDVTLHRYEETLTSAQAHSMIAASTRHIIMKPTVDNIVKTIADLFPGWQPDTRYETVGEQVRSMCTFYFSIDVTNGHREDFASYSVRFEEVWH